MGFRNTLLASLLALLALQAVLAVAQKPPEKLVYRYHLYESMGPIIPHGVISVDVRGSIEYRLVSVGNGSVTYAYSIRVDSLNISGLPGGEQTRQAFLRAFARNATITIDLEKCETRTEAASREAGAVAGALPIYCKPDSLRRIAEELRNQSLLDVRFAETGSGYVLEARGTRNTGNATTTLMLRVVYDRDGSLREMRINITGSAGAAGTMKMAIDLRRVGKTVGGSGANPGIPGALASSPLLPIVLAGGGVAVIAAVILLARRGR